MHIKIYVDNKSVLLCDKLDDELEKLSKLPTTIFVDEPKEGAIKLMLEEITQPNFTAAVIKHSDFIKLQNDFYAHFTLIEAAGGIVQNQNEEILFIERLGKWDLPKGKVEENEAEDAAAIREIEEETGVKNLSLKNKVGLTFHTYHAYEKYFLKTTHWYYLTCANEQNLAPQTEENITAIKWIKIENIKEPLANTYPSIKDILDVFFNKA
jgi:ADP-ribose pyrophosphatase YjhB (NUDIX family)